MTFERDPVSVLFDRGARQLLDRAYAAPGRWTGTRIAGPTPRQVAYFAGQGINVLGRDDQGRDRWAAAFTRALYHQHKWYRTGRGWGNRRMVPNEGRAIRYELGRRLPALGVIPAGRAIRVVSKPGGRAAQAAARKLPPAARIFEPGGAPGPRATDSTRRDWGPLESLSALPRMVPGEIPGQVSHPTTDRTSPSRRSRMPGVMKQSGSAAAPGAIVRGYFDS